MTDRSAPTPEERKSSHDAASQGSVNPNDLAETEAYQQRVREVVGHRGYDEGEDETTAEDEAH